MTVDREALRNIVQRNCDIADARYEPGFTICVYLLKMREYFRWQKGYGYGDHLPRDAVGDWLGEQESYWETLEEEEFQTVPIDSRYLDPFETDAINAHLNPAGLVYSGGLGQFCKPHFFLAELIRHEAHGTTEVYVCGRELARDLASPPAMYQGQRIFLRREALRRSIWERVENWRWSKADNAMGRTLALYDMDKDTEAALDRLTDDQMHFVLWHELGEARVADRLGEEWNALLASLPRSGTELMVRVVRDNLADCLLTVPHLAEQARAELIHGYFGTLSPMRRKMFPALEAAYDDWRAGGPLETLQAAADRGVRHWSHVAQELISIYRADPDPLPRLESCLRDATL